MIIARSPLRITLGGGGTDLPSYYRQFGGLCLAAALQSHVYVSVHRTFTPDIVLRYSELERCTSVEQVRHPLIRAALSELELRQVHLEISTMADIPAGTGLGSSGSFGTAMLRALYRYLRVSVSQRELAEMACHLEIDVLQEPSGKQDQYAAAFGGVNCMEFLPDDTVQVTPLRLSDSTREHLERHLLLFCTGIVRSSASILREQVDRTKQRDQAMLDHLHFIKEHGYRSKEALETGDLATFGRLLHEHWERKKLRSRAMTTDTVDHWYDVARRNGALGGKLIGAGGGGFLMLLAEDPFRLRQALQPFNALELACKFDYEGTRLL